MGEPDETPAARTAKTAKTTDTTSETTAAAARAGAAKPVVTPPKRTKAMFMLVALAAMLVIYFTMQRGQRLLPETWGDDLDKALKTAANQRRKVLVFFTASPPGEVARRIATVTLRKKPNPQNIAKGNYVCVHVVLDPALDSETSKRFRITHLPTMLLLDPDGKELNRREGMIGQLPFSKGFLDCTDVRGPEEGQ